jgi:hypothetical protein
MNIDSFSNDTKVYRLNSIIDVPNPIESLYLLHNILSVARSDNSIELWDTNTWIQVNKIYGIKDIGLRRIFMLNKTKELSNLRIFTISLNGYLIEWSLLSQRQKDFYHNPGGSLWDFDLKNKFVLLACDDGSPRVVKIKKNSIFLEKQFSKMTSKVLSVKWNDYTFFSGHSDGSINK